MRINLSSIAILVLCALALPIASGSAYVLHIFGNANMDETVDQSDLIFLKAIIEGKEKSTELADANFDGKVDAKDIAQVEKIIKGTEKNLTLMDGNNLPITIMKPVERIVVEYLDNADMMQIMPRA
jgi:iron complex transport system substrate-binding protein